MIRGHLVVRCETLPRYGGSNHSLGTTRAKLTPGIAPPLTREMLGSNPRARTRISLNANNVTSLRRRSHDLNAAAVLRQFAPFALRERPEILNERNRRMNRHPLSL